MYLTHLKYQRTPLWSAVLNQGDYVLWVVYDPCMITIVTPSGIFPKEDQEWSHARPLRRFVRLGSQPCLSVAGMKKKKSGLSVGHWTHFLLWWSDCYSNIGSFISQWPILVILMQNLFHLSFKVILYCLH